MMDRFDIEGGAILSGTIPCAGSKNGTLPLMAAALLTDGVTILRGVPSLQDIHTMAMVLRVVGADVDLVDGEMRLDCSRVDKWEAPYELVRKMRASFYVLGPLLARFGKARISLPGGCNLGPRPVDLHLKAMERLGCKVEFISGYLEIECEKLRGARIDLDIASVGATGNVLMAAVGAEGKTILSNAACEPEIIDLANMLIAMGADITGAGTSRIEINGITPLKPVEWDVIPDRIEASTFLLAGAINKSKITVENCRSEHLQIVLDKLADTGVEVIANGSVVTIDARDRDIMPVNIKTAVFPGFPTDLQAPWTSLMTLAKGSSTITDSIYPDRFSHIPELNRLGAKIHKELNTIHISGVDRLTGASVMCSDIRAAAGIIIAATAAKGKSSVLRVYHLDRGYERMENKLSILGAKVRRIRE